MSSSTRKPHSKLKVLKGAEVAGKNCLPKGKSMSPMARLMATFYGIEQK